jgi:hypothetical protein
VKVVIAYVYPAVQPATYRPMARRFANSYMSFPSGSADHEVVALVNGGHHQMERNYNAAFAPVPVRFFHHSNLGKDIGAFQAFAETCTADLLVCLGAPVRFHRGGWLDRIVQSYEDNGPGLYGCWGFHQPLPHIRTTAFWLPPDLLRAYPYQIVNENRYEFEHGHRSILNFCNSIGLGGFMVTWSGCFAQDQWHHIGADECLMLDQHCERAGIA